MNMKEPTSAYVISHNDVTNTNFNSCFPEIMQKLNNASHVALDLEFTALGNNKAPDINHRYVAMKRTAESASIASVGLSIFRLVDDKSLPKPPPFQSSLSDLSNLKEPATLKTTPTDPTSLASSQPMKSSSTRKEPVSRSCSQPILPASSVLSKEEVEGLLSSFLDEEDETADNEFSITTSTKLSATKEIETTSHVQRYECDNFNIMTLKQGTIHLESSTGTFLVKHGYSFDKLFFDGIPFTPFHQEDGTFSLGMNGNDKSKREKQDNRLRNLFKHMMSVLKFHKMPLIIHNGFFDLIYLYHSFIGKLPETYKGFMQAVSDSFPAGIYDTRYLALQADMHATFLAYVFGAADRLRQDRFGKKSTAVKPYFEVKVKDPILKVQTGVKRKRESTIVGEKPTKMEPYCYPFSERGYCNHDHDSSSPLHDVQIVLDTQMGLSKYPQVYTSKITESEGAHAAHFDAYMTGFAYCYFHHTLQPNILKSSWNKMQVSGINVPLKFPPSRTSL